MASATIQRGSRNSEFVIATLSTVVPSQCAGEVTVYRRPEGPNPNRMRGHSYVGGDAAGSRCTVALEVLPNGRLRMDEGSGRSY